MKFLSNTWVLALLSTVGQVCSRHSGSPIQRNKFDQSLDDLYKLYAEHKSSDKPEDSLLSKLLDKLIDRSHDRTKPKHILTILADDQGYADIGNITYICVEH